MGEQIGIYPQDPFFPPGAPLDGRYITQEVNPILTDEQSLGLLTTGMVKNTVAAGVGVLSIGIPGTDYLTEITARDVFWKNGLIVQVVPKKDTTEVIPLIAPGSSGNSPLGEWYGAPTELFFCCQTPAILNNQTYFYLSPPIVRMDSEPHFFMKYRTGANINVLRLHLGLSANPDFNNDTDVLNNTLSFRYTPEISGNWYAMTRNAIPTQTATNTGILVSANTIYQLEIAVSLVGTIVYFLINGAVVHTAIADLPLAATLLGMGLKLYTREAVLKRHGFARYGIAMGGVMV